MKSFILTIIILSQCTWLLSQDKTSKSIVYSKAGSVYSGEIISENVFDIKMVVADNDTIVLSKRKIKKINNIQDDIVIYENGKYHRTSGYFYSISLNSTLGDNDDSNILNFTFGKRLNEKWYAGLGIGQASGVARLPGSNRVSHKFVNLFGYGRYNFKRNKLLYFADSSVGIGIAKRQDMWRGEYTDGIYMQPGIGIEFASRNKIKWSVKLSQYIQKTSGSLRLQLVNSEGLYEYNLLYNRTTIGVGVTF